MDDKSNIHNIHLCRVCLNPKKLDLVSTSNTSDSINGLSCWETLKDIFCEIIWVEDRLISLVCQTCLKRIYEIAEFKKMCVDTNRQRQEFNNKYIELLNHPLPDPIYMHGKEAENVEIDGKEPENVGIDEIEAENVEIDTPAQIEEVILPFNKVLVKTEEADNIDIPKIPADFLTDSVSNIQGKNKGPGSISVENRSIIFIKGKRLSETGFSQTVKKITSHPVNVTLLSAKTSEFIPTYIPLKHETGCKLCLCIFQTSFHLWNHIVTEHGLKIPRRYRCEYCHVGFSSMKEFQFHYKKSWHRNFVALQCEGCGCKTITRQMSAVMLCHCPKQQQTSKWVPAILRRKKTSIVSTSSDKPILCTLCNISFATLRLAKEHATREHKALRRFGRFNCEKCDSSFLFKKQLDHHNITTHYFRCDNCSELYETIDLLQQHIIQDHNVQPRLSLQPKELEWPKDMHCILCNKVFPTRYHLARHIESCPCKKYGSCSICGRSFHMNRIKRHLIKQHGVKLKERNFEEFFKCKVKLHHDKIVQLTVNQPKMKCEQYRECNQCEKYLHISEIKPHLLNTHSVDVHVEDFNLQSYLKSKPVPTLFTSLQHHQFEHSYSLRL